MFNRFKSKHSVSEYKFDTPMFPTVSDRGYWESFSNESYVAEAEKALEYGWPIVRATEIMEFIKSGSRRSERIPDERRAHLVNFALAELVENKGRFLPQIVDGLFAICEETSWCSCAHWADEVPHNLHDPANPYVDLLAGETAEHLVMIITLLREPLSAFCPEIIERVEHELEIRIKTPYLLHKDYWWMGYGERIPNNWNPWIISNVMTVFFLTEKNEERLHTALDKMLDELQSYYDGLPADGGCDEGPTYWNRAGASLFECVYQLKQASGGKLDLFDDEKLGKIAGYLKAVHVSKDFFVNIADAHYSGLAHQMILNFAYAKETRQEELMNFCASVFAQRTREVNPYCGSNIRRIFYNREFFDELCSYKTALPLHSKLEILPELELAGIRKGELLIFAKGGHNDESHNHNDIGSFVFHDAETAVLADVGIGAYTRFTFSEHRYDMIPWVKGENHNIPAFDDITQQYGYNYHADAFDANEDSITVSFASAYPENTGLISLERKLSFTDNGMLCVDKFERKGGKRGSVREVFMSVLPVELDTSTAIIGGKYRLSASSGKISSEFLPFDDGVLERDWGTKGVTRICFDAENVCELEIKLELI